MSNEWIKKIFEQLLHCLDDVFEIVDLNGVSRILLVFDQIQFDKKQLKHTKIIKFVNEVYEQTPNQYLRYRLELLLKRWRLIYQRESKKPKILLVNESPPPSSPASIASTASTCESVFDAIIMDDHHFFQTKSVPELLQRLLKSLDKNYKVTDMATVLNAIDMFEEIDISATQLATHHLIKYFRRMRRNTTNRYLSERSKSLIEKWRTVLVRSDNSKNRKKVKSTKTAVK